MSLRRDRCRSLIRCSTWRVWALSPRAPTATRTSLARVAADEDLEPGMLDALYDPQTSGGLLDRGTCCRC
ncbi:MAG: hypothetical protein ACLU37_11525 [Collinsella sp.]